MDGVVELSTLLTLFKQIEDFVGRAIGPNKEKREKAVQVLRSVLEASTRTLAYITDMQDGGERVREEEKQLSFAWLAVSHSLKDIGETKLSKICNIKNKYWATKKEDGSSAYSEDFLEKAGTSLSNVERLANLALHKLEN